MIERVGAHRCGFCESRNAISKGRFRRADGLVRHRVKCRDCGRTSSDATTDLRARARLAPHRLAALRDALARGVSRREIARVLGISRSAIEREAERMDAERAEAGRVPLVLRLMREIIAERRAEAAREAEAAEPTG